MFFVRMDLYQYDKRQNQYSRNFSNQTLGGNSLAEHKTNIKQKFKLSIK